MSTSHPSHPSHRSPWLWVRRVAITLASLTATSVGIVGFAHTPTGRPLLQYIPAMGATCPVGMDAKLTPEQRDRARDEALTSVRGNQRAASRPALGFSLDETTRADVGEWAARHGVACKDKNPGTSLRCSNVPAAALGARHAAEDVLFLFDSAGRLVALDATRASLDADQAAEFVEGLASGLTRSVGAPSASRGERSGAYLARGTLNQASAEFRFSDYRANVVATNMGSDRIVVREHYQSLRSGS